MSITRESRPAGNQAAHKISSGDNSSITETPGDRAEPTPAEIADLVLNNPRANAVAFAAYQAGFDHGVEWADGRAESQAELAARKFFAMELWEIDNKRRCQIDREFIDVAKRRAAMSGGAA